MMGYDVSWDAGTWLAMITMMLLWWGLLIGLVLWLARGHHQEPPPTSGVRREGKGV